MYKTVVIEYSPKADDMAQKVEEKANEMLHHIYYFKKQKTPTKNYLVELI